MKLTAESFIRSTLEEVWAHTQDPLQHARWDLRFSKITPDKEEALGSGVRLKYVTHIGFGISVEGWGETVGIKPGRTSALRFGSDDPRSLIREGAGSWSYLQQKDRIHFSTVYDYTVRYGVFGQIVDQLIFRPLLVWATRWSFERLRLWLELGLAPELSWRLWICKIGARVALGAVWLLEGTLPKLLSIQPSEVELVRRSGLYWPTPDLTLQTLGLLEVGLGIWLLSGWNERASVLTASIATAAFSGIVLMNDSLAFADPYGGIVKNLGLFAAAFAIWLLSPLTPQAKRVSIHKKY